MNFIPVIFPTLPKDICYHISKFSALNYIQDTVGLDYYTIYFLQSLLQSRILSKELEGKCLNLFKVLQKDFYQKTFLIFNYNAMVLFSRRFFDDNQSLNIKYFKKYNMEMMDNKFKNLKHFCQELILVEQIENGLYFKKNINNRSLITEKAITYIRQRMKSYIWITRCHTILNINWKLILKEVYESEIEDEKMNKCIKNINKFLDF